MKLSSKFQVIITVRYTSSHSQNARSNMVGITTLQTIWLMKTLFRHWFELQKVIRMGAQFERGNCAYKSQPQNFSWAQWRKIKSLVVSETSSNMGTDASWKREYVTFFRVVEIVSYPARCPIVGSPNQGYPYVIRRSRMNISLHGELLDTKQKERQEKRKVNDIIMTTISTTTQLLFLLFFTLKKLNT